MDGVHAPMTAGGPARVLRGFVILTVLLGIVVVAFAVSWRLAVVLLWGAGVCVNVVQWALFVQQSRRGSGTLDRDMLVSMLGEMHSDGPVGRGRALVAGALIAVSLALVWPLQWGVSLVGQARSRHVQFRHRHQVALANSMFVIRNLPVVSLMLTGLTAAWFAHNLSREAFGPYDAAIAGVIAAHLALHYGAFIISNESLLAILRRAPTHVASAFVIIVAADLVTMLLVILAFHHMDGGAVTPGAAAHYLKVVFTFDVLTGLQSIEKPAWVEWIAGATGLVFYGATIKSVAGWRSFRRTDADHLGLATVALFLQRPTEARHWVEKTTPGGKDYEAAHVMLGLLEARPDRAWVHLERVASAEFGSNDASAVASGLGSLIMTLPLSHDATVAVIREAVARGADDLALKMIVGAAIQFAEVPAGKVLAALPEGGEAVVRFPMTTAHVFVMRDEYSHARAVLQGRMPPDPPEQIAYRVQAALVRMLDVGDSVEHLEAEVATFAREDLPYIEEHIDAVERLALRLTLGGELESVRLIAWTTGERFDGRIERIQERIMASLDAQRREWMRLYIQRLRALAAQQGLVPAAPSG